MKETGSGSELGGDKFNPELKAELKNSNGEEAEANLEAKNFKRSWKRKQLKI